CWDSSVIDHPSLVVALPIAPPCLRQTGQVRPADHESRKDPVTGTRTVRRNLPGRQLGKYPGRMDEREHQHGVHGHAHGPAPDADWRWLAAAAALIVAFMAGEVVAGLVAHSLALLSDAAHMLTDAAAIGLALVTARVAGRPASGGYTYGLRRLEILSAQANGI